MALFHVEIPLEYTIAACPKCRSGVRVFRLGCYDDDFRLTEDRVYCNLCMERIDDSSEAFRDAMAFANGPVGKSITDDAIKRLSKQKPLDSA